MKNSFFTSIIFSVISLFFTSVELSAQCNNLTLTLTGKNSTCLANGSIKVVVSGPDAGNIRQSDMQFSVSGTQNLSWAHYPNDSIPNLPAGTYTVSIRAFCLVNQDWYISSATATTTLTSSYIELEAVVGMPRNSLNCIPTGMIPITIMNNTGLAPFTITMTGSPIAYTGPTSFVTSVRGTPYQILNLPAGSYTFTVADACSYTKTVSATVGTRATDFDSRMIADYLTSPATPLPNQCDIVTFMKQYYSNYTDEERHYFYDNARDYFEVAFLVNNIGTPVFVDMIPNGTQSQYINYQLPAPYTIRWLRDNNATITLYLRIKGTSCMQKYKDVYITQPENYFMYSDVGCTDLTVSHYPWSTQSGRLICYPYQWRVVRSDNTVFLNWQGPISDYNTQTVTNVPFGARFEYIDNEGYTWSRTILNAPPAIYSTYSSAPWMYYGITGNIFHSYQLIYLQNNSIFPVGTRFEFISGPTTPIHTDVTIPNTITYFYPFSTVYSSASTSDFRLILSGQYQYRITFPGCAPQLVTIYHGNYCIVTPFSYTTKETCAGLYVFPSGQIGFINYQGTVSNMTTYYQLFSVVPSTIPIDKKFISLGDSLFLPTTGEYRLGMSYSNTYTYEANYDTIFYTQTPFTLNPATTSAYVCENSGVGFIRVEGMGGSGQYKYELYDGGSLVATNTTGVFAYGVANAHYTILLIDTDPKCSASYPQDVNMIDLGVAQIVYTNNPSNLFCLTDNINLKCITLGETTYEWTGPGINSTNKNLQNPVIFAGDIGVGTHTFTVTVVPEGCGHQMVQSVTVTVEDCSGAKNDYKVIIVNTPDSIDILANDKFPALCAPSVTPIITVNPTRGTAAIVNKKVFYTPHTNYIGSDSLTYSVTCGTTTTTAKVFILIIPLPDNVIDPYCFVTPRPTGAWSIKNRLISNTINGGDVFEMSVPLVGDIDGDGIVEIVCAGKSMLTSNFVCDSIKVFEAVNRVVKRKFPVERFHGGFGTIAMADVDKDGFAEIFVATDINASVGNRGYIMCYRHDGTFKWRSSTPYTANATSHAYPYLKIVDFNGDGIPEIIANDCIYNAVTGALLLDCQLITKGWDYGTDGGHNAYYPSGNYFGNFSSAIDMDGDGLPELVAGRHIYKITINSLINPASNSCTILRSAIPGTHTELGDGYTSVADLDLDGTPDVIVIRQNPTSRVIKHLYAWSGKTGDVLHTNVISLNDGNTLYGGSIPFIGDLDGDGVPEISFTVTNRLHAYRYTKGTKTLSPLSWSPLTTTDVSGATTLTLFDFDQDNKMELVYRDMSTLRIIDGTTGINKASIVCNSWTMNEYPVVADVTGSGHANIVVLGKPVAASHGNGYLYVFEHDLSVPGAIPWAPARKVWNQWAYNAVNIKEDLTVPTHQFVISTVFPGADNLLNTPDDIRPYNGFLVQQTTIDKRGVPVFLLPDVTPVPALSSAVADGDSVLITLTMTNLGEAAIGPPIHYTVYKESVSAGNSIKHDSANIVINPLGSATITFKVESLPVFKLVVRINDKNNQFPYQSECVPSNNVIDFINPFLNLLMKKEATLKISPPFKHEGTKSNPVTVLYNENVEYKITFRNANVNNGTTVYVHDTVPAYMNYIGSTPTASLTPLSGNPPRILLNWTIPNKLSMAEDSVKFEVTPQSGVLAASQTLFPNRAWVRVSDTLIVSTNNTWHQGGGVSLMTFSAGHGGTIYNAMEQVLDYRTSPRAGVVIVPDEGYRFAGWSHDDYISLRGETIKAQRGIMYYDTLTIYGNVTLQANFELDEYKVSQREEISVRPAIHTDDNLWAVKDELYVRTTIPGSILRIFTLDGVQIRLHTILTAGETKYKLEPGIYVVTLNNGLGMKVIIK